MIEAEKEKKEGKIITENRSKGTTLRETTKKKRRRRRRRRRTATMGLRLIQTITNE